MKKNTNDKYKNLRENKQNEWNAVVKDIKKCKIYKYVITYI